MIKPDIKKVPQRCGVYFFKNRGGRILYIGKAANLRSRLGSYFPHRGENLRIQKMLSEAAEISWQETDSEIEALILESQLIKKYKPSFNIMLRDDKQYFYVGITKEKFPKIFLTHRLEAGSRKLEATLIGPFTDGSALKTTLRLIRRIFPYCTCKQKHNNYCLNYHIGKCLGFCCLKENQKSKTKNQKYILKIKNEYHKNIKSIKEILSGKRGFLIKKLEKEMGILAGKEKFEEAAGLRDKIEKLKKVFENAQILHNPNLQMHPNTTNTINQLQKLLRLGTPPKRIEGYDVSNIQGEFAVGVMVVFTNGKPDKNQYRKFKIKSQKLKIKNVSFNFGGDVGMLKQVLTRRFNHPEWPWPNLIIVDGGKAQLNTACSVINSKRSAPNAGVIALTKDGGHKGVKIYVENKKEPIPLLKLPPLVRNLILQIDQEAHRFAINYYRKLHNKTVKFMITK